jgi:hypothetical protein
MEWEMEGQGFAAAPARVQAMRAEVSHPLARKDALAPMRKVVQILEEERGPLNQDSEKESGNTTGWETEIFGLAMASNEAGAILKTVQKMEVEVLYLPAANTKPLALTTTEQFLEVEPGL